MRYLLWSRTFVSRRFIKHQQFQLAVREHRRSARDAVSQAVLDSAARFEATLSLALREAQLNNGSTMHTEKEIFFFDFTTELTVWCTSNLN